MICRTSEENNSGSRFQSFLKPHLKVKKHRSIRTSKNCRTPCSSRTQSIPASDINHIFNHEAMLAVSHAIEDLAHDTADGELISTFQHFNNFRCQEKNYRAIARKLMPFAFGGKENLRGTAPISILFLSSTPNLPATGLFFSIVRRSTLCSFVNKPTNPTNFIKKYFQAFTVSIHFSSAVSAVASASSPAEFPESSATSNATSPPKCPTL